MRRVALLTSAAHLCLWGGGTAISELLQAPMFQSNVVNWLILPGLVFGEAFEKPSGISCWNCLSTFGKVGSGVVVVGVSNLCFVLVSVAIVSVLHRRTVVQPSAAADAPTTARR